MGKVDFGLIFQGRGAAVGWVQLTHLNIRTSVCQKREIKTCSMQRYNFISSAFPSRLANMNSLFDRIYIFYCFVSSDFNYAETTEKGSDMQQRAPGRDSNLGPTQRQLC